MIAAIGAYRFGGGADAQHVLAQGAIGVDFELSLNKSRLVGGNLQPGHFDSRRIQEDLLGVREAFPMQSYLDIRASLRAHRRRDSELRRCGAQRAGP